MGGTRLREGLVNKYKKHFIITLLHVYLIAELELHDYMMKLGDRQ